MTLTAADLDDLLRALAIIRGAEHAEQAERVYTRLIIDYTKQRAFGVSHETARALLANTLQRRYPAAPSLLKPELVTP